MKNKKSFISFLILLFIFSTLTVGCSSESNDLKSENEILTSENAMLRDKVYKLGETISEIKLKQEDITLTPLMIDYVEVNDKVRFIEKENYILALPQSGSSILRPVGTNTLATVYETYEFKDIKTVTPIKLTAKDGGRLQEKKGPSTIFSIALEPFSYLNLIIFNLSYFY